MQDLDTKRLASLLAGKRDLILDAWEWRVLASDAIPAARALPRQELRGGIQWVFDTVIHEIGVEPVALRGVVHVHAGERRGAHYTARETRAELEALREAVLSIVGGHLEESALVAVKGALSRAVAIVDEGFVVSATGRESTPSPYAAERLLDAFAKVPAHVAVVHGPDHLYAFVNEAFSENMGVVDPIGKPFGTSNHPTIVMLRSALDLVYATGEPWAAKEVLTAAAGGDGDDLYFNLNFSPLRGEGNAIDAVLLHAYNVTELVRARHALRESEEKLRMAVDAAEIGLWSWELTTDEVGWSDTLCAIFGLAPSAAPTGRAGYLELLYPEDRDQHAEVIRRGVAAGTWEDEFRIRRADGAVRWVLTKARVLHQEEGDVVLGSVIDVTERRHRDEQLRKAQRLEAIGELTAGIAHNFNNMLMGVLPNLALSLKEAPPALVPLLRDAERATERAAELVSQLMTYAGRNRPAARRVESLAALADRTLAICRTTFDRAIAFETRYDPAASALIDAAQVEQAVLNILINARDALAASPAGSPRVLVEVDMVRARGPQVSRHGDSKERDYVRIRVGDNGAGMDGATLARIYEPFFTTKDVGRGTGLGLATAHAIVREHGGWITCDSVPGGGTTFSIHLPGESALPKVVVPPALEALPGGGLETVLVIDDEASIRRVVALMLEPAGYTVRVAASGEEATRMLGDAQVASEVALILLDVSMPGMPGRELRRLLGELAPQASVVYFTGHAFEGTAADDLVLEKPVSHARLLATVREALDRGVRGDGRPLEATGRAPSRSDEAAPSPPSIARFTQPDEPPPPSRRSAERT
jgi:two-component system cell cycle sensor histidine kinase/response regulator CckA